MQEKSGVEGRRGGGGRGAVRVGTVWVGGTRKGGAKEGWGKTRVGQKKGGEPKNSRFFPSLPPQFYFFLLSLGGPFVEFFGGVQSAGTLKCARLEFSGCV